MQECAVIRNASLCFVVLAVALSAGCGDERSVNLTGLWEPDGEITCVEDPPLVREPTTGDGPPAADGMGREPTLLDGETVMLQYELSHVGNTVTVTIYVDGYEGFTDTGTVAGDRIHFARADDIASEVTTVDILSSERLFVTSVTTGIDEDFTDTCEFHLMRNGERHMPEGPDAGADQGA